MQTSEALNGNKLRSGFCNFLGVLDIHLSFSPVSSSSLSLSPGVSVKLSPAAPHPSLLLRLLNWYFVLCFMHRGTFCNTANYKRLCEFGAGLGGA